MHDQLFALHGQKSTDNYQAQAQSIGLDTDQFKECISGNRFAENIRRSALGARQMGIQGTPAFLIGTLSDDGDFLNSPKVLIGVQDYETLRMTILDLLEKKAGQ